MLARVEAKRAPIQARGHKKTSAAVMTAGKRQTSWLNDLSWMLGSRAAYSNQGEVVNRRASTPDPYSLVFFRGQDLTTLVHPGLQIDMVRTAKLAGVLVLNETVGPQGMMCAAHIAPGGRYFSFGDGHGGCLLGLKCNRRPLGRRRERWSMPQNVSGFKYGMLRPDHRQRAPQDYE